jgi:hypothetical protein
MKLALVLQQVFNWRGLNRVAVRMLSFRCGGKHSIPTCGSPRRAGYRNNLTPSAACLHRCPCGRLRPPARSRMWHREGSESKRDISHHGRALRMYGPFAEAYGLLSQGPRARANSVMQNSFSWGFLWVLEASVQPRKPQRVSLSRQMATSISSARRTGGTGRG